jgi:hypothetical protein
MKELFLNQSERESLAEAEAEGFIEKCQGEFCEKSLVETNAKQVQMLTLMSYLPNAISSITAGFFVLFLLGSYSPTVQAALGILLLVVVGIVEVGKRVAIRNTAHAHYVRGETPPLNLVVIAALMVVSMAASYMGGKALVVEMAPPPPKVHNPQIDSLNTLLAAEMATIDRLQRTTWKGKVTVDAVKGINKSKDIQAQLNARIATLSADDDAIYKAGKEKHDAKHLNFGYVLGVIAALADLFLLGLLWRAKRLRWEVAAMSLKSASTGAKSSKQSGGGNMTYMPGYGAARAAGAQHNYHNSMPAASTTPPPRVEVRGFHATPPPATTNENTATCCNTTATQERETLEGFSDDNLKRIWKDLRKWWFSYNSVRYAPKTREKHQARFKAEMDVIEEILRSRGVDVDEFLNIKKV